MPAAGTGQRIIWQRQAAGKAEGSAGLLGRGSCSGPHRLLPGACGQVAADCAAPEAAPI